MKRFLVLMGAAATLAIVVPAWAAKPAHPPHPFQPAHGKGHGHAKGHDKSKGTGSCKMLAEGYRASGTLTSATLTPGTRKNRFDLGDSTRQLKPFSLVFREKKASVRDSVGGGVKLSARSFTETRPVRVPRRRRAAEVLIGASFEGVHALRRAEVMRLAGDLLA